jgi:hypothetical protein
MRCHPEERSDEGSAVAFRTLAKAARAEVVAPDGVEID